MKYVERYIPDGTKKNANGFTIIELVIVIIIIGILATISVPIYRGYTRRAQASEGRALVGSIAAAEKVYYVEKGTWLGVAALTSKDATLNVDASMNKYFTAYSVGISGNGYNAVTATYDSMHSELSQGVGGAPVSTDIGI